MYTIIISNGFSNMYADFTSLEEAQHAFDHIPCEGNMYLEDAEGNRLQEWHAPFEETEFVEFTDD